MAYRIGDKVFAMSDDGSIEGECTIVKGRHYDTDELTSVIGDEIDTETILTVAWADDGLTQALTGYNWSFVPAIADTHEEYNA